MFFKNILLTNRREYAINEVIKTRGDEKTIGRAVRSPFKKGSFEILYPGTFHQANLYDNYNIMLDIVTDV